MAIHRRPPAHRPIPAPREAAVANSPMPPAARPSYSAVLLPQRAAQSCASCGETECFRHDKPPRPGQDGRRAFLLDENWPEIRTYLAEMRQPGDLLGIPLDGRVLGLARYSWPTTGFDAGATAPVTALRRMLRVRRLQAQGPARRLAEIEGAAGIARSLGRRLTEDTTELVVAQSLLPRLWRAGGLGGRAITVVMTRLPMATLQARLDHAAVLAPDRTTLRDFRAPPEIAALFPGRARLLDWVLPSRPRLESGRALPRRIAFAGPTVARKGAFELRAALRGLDLELLLLGSDLEGPDFWRGIQTRRPGDSTVPGTWLPDVAAIVQPSLVEERSEEHTSELQ